MTEKKQILKSASIISLVTIASRILGYVRDQRIALLLGTTFAADAYVLAYRIPNLFRRLVAEGSMTASFIPVFTTYMRERTKEEVWDFANKLFWTLALVVAIITILGMVFSPFVVHLFAGKSAAGDQAVELNRIVFPYLFFVAMAALAMGILNCFHIFGLPAATPGGIEHCDDCFFHRGGVALFQGSCDIHRGGRAGRGRVAVFDASAGAGSQGNDVQVRDLFFASRHQERGAVDDSAACSGSASGRSICWLIRALRPRRKCRAEASPRYTWRTGSWSWCWAATRSRWRRRFCR